MLSKWRDRIAFRGDSLGRLHCVRFGGSALRLLLVDRRFLPLQFLEQRNRRLGLAVSKLSGCSNHVVGQRYIGSHSVPIQSELCWSILSVANLHGCTWRLGHSCNVGADWRYQHTFASKPLHWPLHYGTPKGTEHNLNKKYTRLDVDSVLQ